MLKDIKEFNTNKLDFNTLRSLGRRVGMTILESLEYLDSLSIDYAIGFSIYHNGGILIFVEPKHTLIVQPLTTVIFGSFIAAAQHCRSCTQEELTREGIDCVHKV